MNSNLATLCVLLSGAFISGAFFSPPATAQEYKSQVSFGADYTAAWNGSAFSAETDSNVDFEGLDGNLSLNYAHKVSKRVQVGAAFTNENQEIEVGPLDRETTRRALLVFGAFNFNDDFKEAWFAGGGFSRESYEADSDGPEYDVNGIRGFVGKRFSLENWGIRNLTYAPMITFAMGDVSGDMADAGVDTINRTTLDIIKFDLLF